MNILVTGGTGFIGQALVNALLADGHHLTLLAHRTLPKESHSCVIMRSLAEWSSDQSFEAVINLSGAPIMGQRWTTSRKKTLWDSRIGVTHQLLERMTAATIKPRILISGSAIGIYGDQRERILSENDRGDHGFAFDLCHAWEEAALKAEAIGVRVALLRTGLVVGRKGGFLQPMRIPFSLGLGGNIGDGQQWMSWIHLDDHIALTRFLLASKEARGIFNATAPNPVTNQIFTQTLAHLLKRPAFCHLPKWFLKGLLGEMAELLIGSQRVIPERAESLGFRFSYPTLEPALEEALGRAPRSL
ncbi:MAG: TIGR01777 family protein [Methylococcus sp.]|jgi:uncharacterized protein (TIGR01777 family)|nr:MAG: TIGR01777 family protein [Methylococcus sp.]